MLAIARRVLFRWRFGDAELEPDHPNSITVTETLYYRGAYSMPPGET
jgi:hypothetical protein